MEGESVIGSYELNQIYTGDCRELSKGIPDHSIDLIFTDPPYSKQYLYLYEWLAEEAARLLKPTGFLMVYVGGMYKSKIMGWFDKNLEYWWDFIAFNTGNAPIIWPRQVISRYKSILAYRPQGGTGKPRTNVLSVWKGSDVDKRYHIWQQDESTARYYIDCFSAPGDIVFDPCGGGGTTPNISAMLKRRFLAFEIDSSQAGIARARLTHNTQAPLFPAIANQMDLAL